MTLKTYPWNPVDDLNTPEAQRIYLEAAFEDGDLDLIIAAVRDVAQVQGLSEIAASAGVSRKTMDESFRKGGNLTLATLSKVAGALGSKLTLHLESNSGS